MWTLTSKKTGSVYYLLSEKKRHLVGRLSADLILVGDSSISRSHACLYPTKDSVKAIDIDSKYGTFYNENIENKVPMTKNVPVELKNGERIKFGMLDNEWILSKLNICSLTSMLTVDHRVEMTEIFNSLDARIINRCVQSCTHLTMSEITVTHKVIYALVENIPIVSIEFWRQYLANLRAGQGPPKAVEFRPKNAESSLNIEDALFGAMPSRKTLFAGKTFVFMSSKPYEKYQPIIISAGGLCENLYKGISKMTLAKKDVIIIRSAIALQQTQTSQATYDSICDYIKKKGHRLIPEAEIGLAILHCCTNEYCNPAFDILNRLAVETNEVLPCGDIIANETSRESCDKYSASESATEIPESVVYEPTENKTAAMFEGLEETEKHDSFAKSILSRAMLSRNVIPAKGKRKSSNCESSNHQSKKMNLDTNEVFVKQSTNQDVPYSDGFSQNLIVESSQSSSADGVTSQFEMTSRATNTKNTDNIFSGFIHKSQITQSQNTQPSLVDINASSQLDNAVTKKRARVAAICSDDDEDDLFAFNSTTTKRTRKDAAPKSKETLFAFGVTSERRKAGSSQSSGLKDPLSEEISPKITQKQNKFALPAIKSLEIKTGGWLTKSNTELEVEDLRFDPEISSWIDSMKDGFEVRLKSVVLSVKSFQDHPFDEINSQPSTSTGKNFKAFKKRCYKRQTSVISTVSVYVELESVCEF